MLLGTGRLLDIGDFKSTNVQSFDAIADASITRARSILARRVLSPAGTGSVTGAAVNWATQRGWFVDLPPGEHVDNRSNLAYGAVAFITHRTGGSDGSASLRLILIDASTGDRFSGSPFVSTVLSPTANASGLTTVLTRDGRLSFTTRDDKGKVSSPARSTRRWSSTRSRTRGGRSGVEMCQACEGKPRDQRSGMRMQAWRSTFRFANASLASLKVFRPGPLVTPKDARSSLQMRAIA